MKRTALAVAITTILGIEFGYIPSSFSLVLPEQVSAISEQSSVRVHISPEYGPHAEGISCQNKEAPSYKPTDVGLPDRREGGGTR